MYFLIGFWGSRIRKIYANYLFLLYTLGGSVFILCFLFYLLFLTGSTNYYFLVGLVFSKNNIIFLVFLIFLGVSVKVPLIPVHIWLPEAHVEAPTIGSVLLAGIVLKLGFYVFFRVFFCVEFWIVYVFFLIFIIGFYFPSMSAFSQIDVKKIIAYSSISHMNFGMFGFFSVNLIGMLGSAFLMVGHAFVASLLFFCIGILYDRYKSRLIYYYGGLFSIMPF
jgi:NADH:ubiquinone oxidoreductase subunit 4 (subunit M)